MIAADPDRTDAGNTVAPSPQKATSGRSTAKGAVPVSILDRYLIERDRQGRPEGFYRDHRAVDPMFRDEGRRLITRQTYPDTIADMMKIAQHRGWTQVRVTGDEAFRREAWVQARTLGIEVRGYKPRERDRQAAGDRTSPAPSRDTAAAPSIQRAEQRLKDAAVVVRRLISDPAAQARLLERAHAKAREALPSLSRQRDTLRRREQQDPRKQR